jgi:hypothetical protein
MGDGNSGPVVAGVSIGATGFGLGAAADAPEDARIELAVFYGIFRAAIASSFF